MKQLIPILYCLTCLASAHAQDSTATNTGTPPATLNSLATVDDVVTYANESARQMINDHPGASLNSQWPDPYVGELSDVDHKTLITAFGQLPNATSNASDDGHKKMMAQRLLEKAILKFSAQADIPNLLASNSAEMLYVVLDRKWQDDPQVTAYLVSKLEEYQSAPPPDTEKTTTEVLNIASVSNDSKVLGALEDAIEKGANDPKASAAYQQLLAVTHHQLGYRKNNASAVVPSAVAPDTSPQSAPSSSLADITTQPLPPLPTGSPTQPSANGPWTNSLGMKFVPAGTDEILFGIWDVRVQDFEAFVNATTYDATQGVVLAPGQKRGNMWKSPGFTQAWNSPVTSVSWHDAQAFCEWLTKKEQAGGWLLQNQEYRLPQDIEWSKAVGLSEDAVGKPEIKNDKLKGIYPWGTQWPPPPHVGNYNEHLSHDGFANTSPVGSFPANPYGLYDMGGNVWNWCEDKLTDASDQRVLRGGSFSAVQPDHILSSCRVGHDPGERNVLFGFRVVVVVSP